MIERLVQLLGKVRWGRIRKLLTGKAYGLTELDHFNIKRFLDANHYIILTWRSSHLSSYGTALATWIKTGKWGKWSHALMNVENEGEHMLMEATGVGVHWSKFTDVFDCDAVCLLKPARMTNEKWAAAMERAKTELGKPYDNLFDLSSDKALSCVELVRCALQGEPNYKQDFADFEKMITEAGNLVPDMFYSCLDFEIVLEIRR